MQPLTLTIRGLIAGVLIIALSGCASIIDGGRKEVTVRSQPTGAKVTVIDKKGVEVSVQQTPAVFTLKRGGAYSTARYRLLVELPGHEPVEAEIKSKLNGWYFGNLLFGGLVGMLIVDPLTGAMWKLSPNEVDLTLSPNGLSSIQADGDELLVMLRRDVPAAWVPALEPLPVTQ